MFDLHAITLVNFRSYAGEHTFVFPTKSGLYFLTGENNVALGSNGAGKSTFLDAIVWVLFGRTARGLKASEVITWGAASCQVKLELTVGENRYTIIRTQKPNNLLLDGNPVDQGELQKYLRLNFSAFMYSILNAQFGQSFFSLSPAEKLSLFSDILNLEYWLQRSVSASETASEIGLQIGRISAQISNLSGLVSALMLELANYSKYEIAFDEENKERIKFKRDELNQITNAALSMDDKLSALNAGNRNKLKSAEKVRDIWLENLRSCNSEKSELTGKISALEAQIKASEALSGSCPTCWQPVAKDKIASRTHTLKVEIARLNCERDGAKADADMAMREIVRSKMRVDTIINELNDAKETKNQLSLLEAKAAAVEDELTEIATQKNPYKPLITDIEFKIKNYERSRMLDILTKLKAEEEYEATMFWVKGFKRVRLFIIEQAFKTLELEVNNSLTQLGLTDWEITFDVERENKSGGITKGFVVFVKSPANSEPVRWESWSGGETQRLQLAGDLGLANLIMQQAGLRNTIEFFDEPSTHLSTEGMMDLANMLHERAVNEEKRIWIVDHTAITNFGEFEGIITARKTVNGSTID